MMNAAIKNDKRLVVLIVLGVVLALTAVMFLSVGCSPKEAGNSADSKTDQASSSKTDPMADQPVNWTMDSDCQTCHTAESESMTDKACPQASAHTGQTCNSCHTEEAALKTAHDGVKFGGKPASKATIVSVNPQTCITCHGSLEEMATKTVGSKALTDSNGLSENPHARPAGVTHEENPATCTDCHNAHSKNLNKDAMKYCAQCHHRGVFQCGTCHEIRERKAEK